MKKFDKIIFGVRGLTLVISIVAIVVLAVVIARLV